MVNLVFLTQFCNMNKGVDIIFWIAISIVLVILFGVSSDSFRYSFYFISFYLPIIISTSWFINSILVPNYLLKRKFFRFFLYLVYTLIVSVNLVFILVFVAFLLLSYYRIDNIRSLMTDFRMLPLIMYLIVLFYGFISLLKQYFDLKAVSEKNGNDHDEAIIVRSERKDRKVKCNDILYIESMSDYVIIFLEPGERVVTKTTISTLDNKLGDNFIRIHRSYIVNAGKVGAYSKEMVIIKDKQLPVSRTYKRQAAEFLGRYMASNGIRV